jgi:hypothetical protein
LFKVIPNMLERVKNEPVEESTTDELELKKME